MNNNKYIIKLIHNKSNQINNKNLIKVKISLKLISKEIAKEYQLKVKFLRLKKYKQIKNKSYLIIIIRRSIHIIKLRVNKPILKNKI